MRRTEQTISDKTSNAVSAVAKAAPLVHVDLCEAQEHFVHCVLCNDGCPN